MRNGCFRNGRCGKHGKAMRFFDRENEIARLRRAHDVSAKSAQFTVLTGRRRIGKTSLVLNAFSGEPLLYFFVARKAESELCHGYLEQISQVLGVPTVGEVSRFADIFRYVMELAKSRPLTLMIDEFQEFLKVNKSVYSEMQDIWDRNKRETKMNLIVCGSVNSLMNKLFCDKKEPLYGRQTDTMKLRSFTPSVLRQILAEYNPSYSNEDLLALYLLTGGVAKYVELFVDRGLMSWSEMLDAVFERDSYFLEEGKAMLVEGFGRDYGMYFSILSLIAQGHNTRGDIEGILRCEIGGYLSKLISDYELIAKRQPLFEKSANKNVHYAICDKFLNFWFRYIYKYNYMLEVGGNDKLRELAGKNYHTYSGWALESWFRDKLVETGAYTRIGYWHDRRGENEIDIIAVDDLERRAEIYEVKRQKEDIDFSILRAKTDVFLKATGQLKGYDITYKGLSLEDM